MHVLIAYDITANKTRKTIFDALCEKGLHAQKSVFECELHPDDLRNMQRFAASLDLEPQDSVVFYPLCKRCSKQVHILGQGIAFVQSEWMIV